MRVTCGTRCSAVHDRGRGPAGGPDRRRRGTPAQRAQPHGLDRHRVQLLPYLHQCGDLCSATGRAAEALTLWAACAAVPLPEGHTYPPWFTTRREEKVLEARQALGPGRARAAEDRGTAMSLATATEYALLLTAPDPPPATAPGRTAQRPRTGAGHPGRPGPDQRADRRRAVHQRPHRRLASGPDQGQDRVPPPHRSDPPGPQRKPGLARRCPSLVPVGQLTPAAAAAQKGSDGPCPRTVRPTRLLLIEANAESTRRTRPVFDQRPEGGQ